MLGINYRGKVTRSSSKFRLSGFIQRDKFQLPELQCLPIETATGIPGTAGCQVSEHVTVPNLLRPRLTGQTRCRPSTYHIGSIPDHTGRVGPRDIDLGLRGRVSVPPNRTSRGLKGRALVGPTHRITKMMTRMLDGVRIIKRNMTKGQGEGKHTMCSTGVMSVVLRGSSNPVLKTTTVPCPSVPQQVGTVLMQHQERDTKILSGRSAQDRSLVTRVNPRTPLILVSTAKTVCIGIVWMKSGEAISLLVNAVIPGSHPARPRVVDRNEALSATMIGLLSPATQTLSVIKSQSPDATALASQVRIASPRSHPGLDLVTLKKMQRTRQGAGDGKSRW